MMIRSRRFQYWIARLALAAIVLLALVPTVSRALDSGARHMPEPMAAMCTSGGLSWATPASVLHTGQQTPTPAAPMQDDYCAYCPLLAAAVPAQMIVILVPAMLPSTQLPEAHAPPLRDVIVLRGLGARGPPILL